MGAQTHYGFKTPIGAAGGIVDIAPYAIDTFLNEEDTGKMMYGIGVVNGTTPGTNVAMPKAAAVAGDFCGITVNNRTTEYDLEGKVTLRKAASIGVMQYGRVYARVATGVTPAYGESAYLVTDGKEAGFFTNAAGSGTTVAVKARFRGTVNNGIAVIELFNDAR